MAYREPEFLPWDGRRVPITFVGGYLGAGKTTLINELLAQTDRPIAVIVNDVGEINVDAALIRKRHGDTLELTDGCVCCSSIDGFGAAFDQIRARDEPPDQVVVELSGVAEPLRLLPWGNSAGFMLDGVVIVVAADQLLDSTLPGWVRTHRDQQIAAADLVVLTKVDLLEPVVASAVDARLNELAPGTPVVTRTGDGGAIGRLLGLGGRRPGGAADLPAATLFDAHEVHRVVIDEPMGRDELDALLDQICADELVIRVKGIVAMPDDELLLVQVVGSRREVTPLPATERTPATDLVVISLRAG